MKFWTIVLLCIVAAVCYGIVHDQITARICIEYFTIGHPDIFGTDDPTLLGLGWGVVATWWVGLILGVPLAFAAQYGESPKCSVRSLVRPMGILLGLIACCAVLAGVSGFAAATAHWVFLTEPLASEVPASRHVPFLTDLWIHQCSYGSGFAGGVMLCWRVWQSRQQSRLEDADRDSLPEHEQALRLKQAVSVFGLCLESIPIGNISVRRTLGEASETGTFFVPGQIRYALICGGRQAVSGSL